MGIHLPALRPWEGSWAIIHTATGLCALELFKPDRARADRMNGAAFHAVPIGAYLASVNAAIREGATA